jgi:hypothetical protein
MREKDAKAAGYRAAKNGAVTIGSVEHAAWFASAVSFTG